MFSRFGRRCLSVVAWSLFSVGFTELLLQLGNSSTEAILSIVMLWVLVTVFGYSGIMRPPNSCLLELLRYCSGIAVLFLGWGSNNIGEVVSVKSCFLHVWHTFRSFLMLLLFAFFMQSRSDNDEFSSVFARCCYVLGDCSDGCVVDSFCIVCIHQAGLTGQSFCVQLTSHWSNSLVTGSGFAQLALSTCATCDTSDGISPRSSSKKRNLVRRRTRESQSVFWAWHHWAASPDKSMCQRWRGVGYADIRRTFIVIIVCNVQDSARAFDLMYVLSIIHEDLRPNLYDPCVIWSIPSVTDYAPSVNTLL